MAASKKPLPENESRLSVRQKQELARQGWKARGSAPLGWEEGMEVVGVYVALIPKATPDQSAILVLDQGGARVRYWCPKILQSRVEAEFGTGEEIYILCTGKNIKVKGRAELAWGFEVFGK